MKKIVITLIMLIFAMLTVGAEESYDLAYTHVDGYARIVKELKWGLLDENLAVVKEPEWDYLGDLSENLRLVRSGELYGFADAQGRQVIAPQFAQAENFSCGLASVKNEVGLWGYIDTSGNLVIPYTFELANSFSDNLALIKQGGLYGYIDTNGSSIIAPQFEEAYPFSEGLACVKSDGFYGYISTDGSWAIAPEYELAYDFSEGFAVVKSGGYGLIDKKGDQKIPTTHEYLSYSVNNGLLKAKKDDHLYFIDSQGKAKTKAIFTYLGDFSEGLCPAATESGFGYLNTDYEMVISPQWENAGIFSEGFAPVQKDGLWGYINTEGQAVTEFQYAACSRITANFALVTQEDGLYQYIHSSTFEEKTESPSQGIVPMQNTLILEIGQNVMKTDSGDVELEVAPAIYEGRTLLPIRAVIEAIGGTVSWDGKEQKITLSRNGHLVILQINKAAAFLDGRITLLDAVPIIENNRTLSPLRFAAEALGCEVVWNEKNRQIYIYY